MRLPRRPPATVCKYHIHKHREAVFISGFAGYGAKKCVDPDPEPSGSGFCNGLMHVCVCVCRLQEKVLAVYGEALALYADAELKDPSRGPELAPKVLEVQALMAACHQ